MKKDKLKPPEISCIVCTFKRPKKLKLAIESLIKQNLSPREYEIIVVDNNSGDSTSSVVEEFVAQGISNLIYVLESRLGLSYARNAGVGIAQGDIVAFLDDDAEASTNWLSALLEIYAICPDIWSVGGKVLPKWEQVRPDWLNQDLLSNLSILDLGNKIQPLDWPNRVIGANYSFKKQVFLEIGGFSTHLGRRGNLLLGNEDTEIQERIHQYGKFIYYTPNAIVYHNIPEERMCKTYFYRRAYGTGRTQALLLASKESNFDFLKTLPGVGVRIPWRCIKILMNISNSEKRFQISRRLFEEVGFFQQGMQVLFSLQPRENGNILDT